MSMNHIIEKITWLKNRMLFKHREKKDSQAVNSIEILCQYIYDLENLNVESPILDQVLNKYYYGFSDDKTNSELDFNYGYTKEERKKIKEDTINIIKDTHLAILQSYTIKDQNLLNTDFEIYEQFLK